MLFHSIVNGIVTTWQNVLHSRCVIRDDDLYWYVRISMNTLICACVYVYVRGRICVCRYGCLWVCLRVRTILYVYVWAVHEVNRAVLRYMCITCLCVHLLIESASRVLCSIVCMTMYSMYTSFGNDCVNESTCIQQLSAPLILLLFDYMYLTGDIICPRGLLDVKTCTGGRSCYKYAVNVHFIDGWQLIWLYELWVVYAHISNANVVYDSPRMRRYTEVYLFRYCNKIK